MRPRHTYRKRARVLPRAAWLLREARRRAAAAVFSYKVTYVIGTAMSSAKKGEYVWVRLYPEAIPVARRIYRSTNRAPGMLVCT